MIQPFIIGSLLNQGNFVVLPPPPSGCNVQADQFTGTTAANDSVANGSTTNYVAGPFVAGSSYTPCKATVRILSVGSPTFTLKCGIYSNNSGPPGSLIGGWSDAISVSTVGSSEQDFTMTNMTTNSSLTNGTTYHLVLQAVGSPDDFTNYIQWSHTNGGGLNSYNSSDGSTWSTYNTTLQYKFTLYHS